MTWRVAKSLLHLREQINTAAPGRSRASDGTIGDASHQSRASDHNPWVRDGVGGVVTAMDITHDPAGGCDAQHFVDLLLASRDGRIKYIIWNRRIVSARVQPWQWRPYGGRNPHDKHFHLSVVEDQAGYDSTVPWRI
jgi:hypothetical protein